jgi:hypothetical protein
MGGDSMDGEVDVIISDCGRVRGGHRMQSMNGTKFDR